MLTKKKQTKTYTLKIDEPLNLSFVFTSKRDNCPIYFEISNDNDEILVKDKHNMKKGKEIFNLPAKEGTYYLDLSSFTGCYNKEFELSFIKTKGNFEEEPNDKIPTATSMLEKKFYTGYLQNRPSNNDSDYYKIDVKEKGKLKLAFKHDIYSTSSYFYIRLFNYDNDKLVEYKSKLNKRGIEKNIDVEKGEYFVSISTFATASNIRNVEYNIAYLLTK